MKSNTADKKKETVIAICEEYAKDEATIESICESVGKIHQSTFYRWLQDCEEWNDLYKEAQEKARQTAKKRLCAKARSMIEKWLDKGRNKNTRQIFGFKDVLFEDGEGKMHIVKGSEMELIGMTVDTEDIPVAALNFLLERLHPDFLPKLPKDETETEKPEVGFDLST